MTNKTSVDDRLSEIRRDLTKLVTALNKNGAYADALKVQSALVAINEFSEPCGIEGAARWAWPPRFDKDGNYVLVENGHA